MQHNLVINMSAKNRQIQNYNHILLWKLYKIIQQKMSKVRRLTKAIFKVFDFCFESRCWQKNTIEMSPGSLKIMRMTQSRDVFFEVNDAWIVRNTIGEEEEKKKETQKQACRKDEKLKLEIWEGTSLYLKYNTI